MTQRERITEERTRVYNAPAEERTIEVPDEEMINIAPKDLVRWGPVIAGLFAALSTLAALTLLGVAIGASAFEPGAEARNFGIGAGIWGAITALIAFFVGGLIAGRTSAVKGSNSGIMNGAMVWFVTIPLLLYSLGSGLSALARTAGSIAGTAAEVAAPAAGAAADNPAAQATAQAALPDGAAVQATAQALTDSVTPQQIDQAANTTANSAWGTLLSLGLAAAAAIGGGYLGARTPTTTTTPRRATR